MSSVKISKLMLNVKIVEMSMSKFLFCNVKSYSCQMFMSHLQASIKYDNCKRPMLSVKILNMAMFSVKIWFIRALIPNIPWCKWTSVTLSASHSYAWQNCCVPDFARNALKYFVWDYKPDNNICPTTCMF